MQVYEMARKINLLNYPQFINELVYWWYFVNVTNTSKYNLPIEGMTKYASKYPTNNPTHPAMPTQDSTSNLTNDANYRYKIAMKCYL